MGYDINEAQAESIVIFKRLEALRRTFAEIIPPTHSTMRRLDETFGEDRVRDDPSPRASSEREDVRASGIYSRETLVSAARRGAALADAVREYLAVLKGGDSAIISKLVSALAEYEGKVASGEDYAEDYARTPEEQCSYVSRDGLSQGQRCVLKIHWGPNAGGRYLFHGAHVFGTPLYERRGEG